MKELDRTIDVIEIFKSIQGESTWAGRPCIFIRLEKCNLRCSYCDTKYAYTEGQDIPVADVLARILEYDVPLVEATGGEPLAQESMPELLTALCDSGKTVLIESSGAVSIEKVDPRVHVIMDVKCPDSGMSERIRWDYFDLLKAKDEVKFVIASRRDYEFARDLVRDRRLHEQCAVLFSTAFGLVDRKSVVEWILEDRLPVRFQLQIHKFVWPPDQRGV